MRRFVNTILLLLVILPLAAQVPDWYNAASRKMLYDPELYYTGFVEGSRQSDETFETAIARIKDAARVELATTIRTSVEQNLHNRTQSDLLHNSTDFNEQIEETFISETRITSSIRDIPGLKIESYHIPSTNEIVAFAYVKKNTLINILVKRTSLGIAKCENAIEQTKRLMTDGHKNEAKKVVIKAQQQLLEVEEAQALLNTIEENADEEMLQYTSSQVLEQQLNRLNSQLANAIMVCVNSQADLFGTDYTNLTGNIKGELSRIGVTFISIPDSADWTINISASAYQDQRHSWGNVTSYTAYVKAHISIDKSGTGQRVYEELLESEKGAHTVSFEEAAQKAYKQISSRILEIIKQYIQ